jgi:hypothetical protein
MTARRLNRLKDDGMKRNTTFAFLAIGLLAAFGIAIFSKRPTSGPALQTPFPLEQPEASKTPAPEENVDSLVSHGKLDPAVVIPTRGRAYSISRTQSLPEGDALEYVQSLLQKSGAGDATATYAIYLAVSQCKSTLNAPSLSLAQIYREQGIEEQYKNSIENYLIKCEALISDPALSDEPWLKRAADQGSIEAKIMFAIDSGSVLGQRSNYLANPERLIEYRAEAIHNLQSAASTGSVDALMALGNAYEKGILTDKSTPTSLAYYKAVYSISPNSALQELIARESKNLSNRENDAAEKLSIQIVDNCCR